MKKLIDNILRGWENVAFLLLVAVFSHPTFAQSLPRPTLAHFNKGARFKVEGCKPESPLNGFPVLVRIREDFPKGFSYDDLKFKSTGGDIVFINNDGNALPFEIDTWNPEGESLIWVRLPLMKYGTEFVMCWGSETIGKTICSDNPFAGYYGVWHMNDAAAKDSSINGLDCTPDGTVEAVDAKLGKGIKFTTSGKITTTKSTPNSDFTDAISFEAWAKTQKLDGIGSLFGKEALAVVKFEKTKPYFTTPGKKDFSNFGYSIEKDKWHHLVLTFVPGGEAKLYVDGELKGTQQDDQNGFNDLNNDYPIVFGSNQWDQYYNGILDECRLLTKVLAPDWIYANYKTQSDENFLTAEEAIEYEVTAEPQVGVAVLDVQYTNATLSVSAGSLGMNAAMTESASHVDSRLLIATDNSFASPVCSITLDRFSSVPETINVTIVPLITNITYYAKVVSSNSFGVDGESEVSSFTTRRPSRPSGSALLIDRGFTSLTAKATVSDFGVGAESSTIRLEASVDGFETVIASGEITPMIGEQESITLENLASSTEYAFRIRIRNDWGLDTFIDFPSVVTRSVPFATNGIGWKFSQDGATVDISFGITGVYDDLHGTATLFYDGSEIGAQDITGAGTLTWQGIPAAEGAAAVTIVISAANDEQTFSQTFTATIVPEIDAVGVTDFADHQSAESSVRVNPGDIIYLPELVGTDFYYLGNNRFADLKDSVLTAKEPGILGVFSVKEAGAVTNVLPVIVLPQKIGNGDIYIFKDQQIGNNWGNWDEASKWEKVGSENNDSCPVKPDDIAILGYWKNTGIQFQMNANSDINIGALYVGNFRNAGANASFRTMGRFVFSRTDGKPALVQFCANDRHSSTTANLSFNAEILGVEFPCGVIVDGGWDGVLSNRPQATFSFSKPKFLLPEGKTFLLRNFCPSRSGEGITINAPFHGGGVIWNRSAANFNWTGESLASFNGIIRDSGHAAASFSYQAPAFVRSPGSNTLAEVIGFVSVNTDSNPHLSPSSAGVLQTGYNQSWRDALIHQDPWFTGRGLMLHGGTYRANSVEKVWGYGAADKKIGDVLSLSGGLNFLDRSWSREQLSGNPINWVEFKSLVHEDKSSVVLWRDFWNNAGVSSKDTSVTVQHPDGTAITETIPSGSARTNHVMIISGIAAHSVGPDGDPRTTALHPVVPWMLSPVSNSGSGWNALAFGTFDENGRLVTPQRAEVASLTAAEPGADVVINDKNIQISADVSVNALLVNNQNKGKTLGEGRTLSVTSG